MSLRDDSKEKPYDGNNHRHDRDLHSTDRGVSALLTGNLSPKVICHFLRRVAGEATAKVRGYDITLIAAAEMIERFETRRDRERAEWLAEQDRDGYRMNAQEKACARAAFDAGWEACKRG